MYLIIFPFSNDTVSISYHLGQLAEYFIISSRTYLVVVIGLLVFMSSIFELFPFDFIEVMLIPVEISDGFDVEGTFDVDLRGLVF